MCEQFTWLGIQQLVSGGQSRFPDGFLEYRTTQPLGNSFGVKQIDRYSFAQ